MKMGCGFLLSGVFWGIVLVLFGIAVMIKAIFGINIPVFKILFALILIFIGFKLLTGSFGCQSKKDIYFDKVGVEAMQSSDKYNIVFGKGDIDLTKISIADKNGNIDIQVVFGEGIIKISPEVPTIVYIESVFAGAKTPDGNEINFGKYIYKNAKYSEKKNCLIVKANVVFGSIKIEESN